jgi:hypothetical protein
VLPGTNSVEFVESRIESAADESVGAVVRAVAFRANVELGADKALFDVEPFHDISVEMFDGRIDWSLE